MIHTLTSTNALTHALTAAQEHTGSDQHAESGVRWPANIREGVVQGPQREAERDP